MSYILDALKKSEEENKLGTLQTLETPPMGYVDMGKPEGAKHYWIISFLIVVVSILAALVFFDYYQVKEQAKLSQQVGTEGALDSQLSSENNTVNTEIKADAAEVVEATDSITEVDNVTLENNTSNLLLEETSDEPVLTEDLPLEVKLLNISVVSYSPTPSASFVMVDSKLYRNAAILDNGAVIKEIKAEGVVISFKGKSYFREP